MKKFEISLDDMMTFCFVVETRSFTKAAEELGIGKARVSQIISRLEQRLNTKLLNRSTRSLAVTDAGQTYFEQCVLIRDIALKANSSMQSHKLEPSGTLKISVPLGLPLIGDLLSKFIEKYPKVTLDILESDKYQNLIQSRCDIAIRASVELEDSSLYAVKVGEINDIICASPEYLEKFDRVNEPEHLKDLDWISHQIVHGDNILHLHSDKRGKTKVQKKAKVLVRTSSTMKRFLLNGMGFGLLPSFVVKKELESGQLTRILDQYHDVRIPLYAVYVNKKYMPYNLEVFLDYLKIHNIY